MRSRLPVRIGIVLAVGALVLATASSAAAYPQGRGGSLGAMTSTPRTLNFGSVPVYGYACQTVWIKNTTTAYVQWVDTQWIGKTPDDFTFCEADSPNSCFLYSYQYNWLAPGDSCSLVIAFTPDEAGGHSATLQLLWVDGYYPDVVHYFISSTGLKGSAFWE